MTLTSASLAQRSDLRLGRSVLRPSLLIVAGPVRRTTVEPRVMQVLVALAEAAGAVVSRDELIRLCWDGRVVGEDSINRAIAEARRAARETEACFSIETIPRVGYRLLQPREEAPCSDSNGGSAAPIMSMRGVKRRWLIGSGLAAGVLAAGTVWWTQHKRTDPRVAAWVESAQQELRLAMPDAGQRAAILMEKAVALDSENAALWGLLALAYNDVVRTGSVDDATAALVACQRASHRALALDRKEGNALAALATLPPFVGDWAAAEDRLLQVLDVAPLNTVAIGELVLLLQATGRCIESQNWNERVAALDPYSPLHQYRRALKHWIFGRQSQADLTIDRALQLWPRHPVVWNTRVMLFAFTNRARPALGFLEQRTEWPESLPDATIEFWRTMLIALDRREPGAIEAARAFCRRAIPESAGFAVLATMVFSLLGDLDMSFLITNGYLLRKGALVGSLWTGAQQLPINDIRRRETMNLFTPAAAAMRADPRFAELCDELGLSDYWRKRKIAPDAFLFNT